VGRSQEDNAGSACYNILVIPKIGLLQCRTPPCMSLAGIENSLAGYTIQSLIQTLLITRAYLFDDKATKAMPNENDGSPALILALVHAEAPINI
jgi:hypothetical protein